MLLTNDEIEGLDQLRADLVADGCYKTAELVARAIQALAQPTPLGAFVTVRAAVVIRELANGGHSWSIRGRSDLSDRVVMADAGEYLDESVHSAAFITARVPIVKPVEVEGEVEP